jgi:tyrosine-protein kinase Etk/Wzc
MKIGVFDKMENTNNRFQENFAKNYPLNGEEEVSLQDYLRILSRNRWIIAISFIVVMFFTIYLTFTTPPQYEATTLIMLSPGQTASSLFQNPWVPSGYLKVNNEIEVLKSKSLARRVINTLKNSADSLYILGAREYEQKGLNIGSLVSAISSNIMKLFGGSVEDEDTVIDTLDIELVNNLQESMKVEPIRETEAIRLRATSVDPDEAALIANTIANEYYKLDLEFNLTEVVETKDFIEEQLKKIEKDLVRSEENLREYQEREQIFGLDKAAETLVDQLSTFESIYYTTLAELKVAKERLAHQQEALNEREQWIANEIINTTNPLITELRRSIARIEADKITAISTQGYTEESAGIQELNVRIEDLKRRLLKEAQNLSGLGLTPEEQSQISLELLRDVLFSNVEVMSLEAKSKEYRQLVDQYSAELNRLPKRSLEYARLDREKQVNEKYYMLLNSKYQESRIAEASRISNVRIVDPALPPRKPVKPKKKMNLLLGAILGLGLGVGIAFLREYLDHSVRTEEDLAKFGLPVLSLVPSIDIKYELEKFHFQKNDKSNGDLTRRLVTHFDPKSTVAESYRTLRTNIQFLSPDNPVKSLVVSSPGPRDGKTTTISNLAITFANLGKKTLLIDGDLRKPMLSKIFKIASKPGLVDLILNDLPYEEVIRETKIQNLNLVMSGGIPPNPSELLGSRKLSDFLSEMENRFDIILMDSPPIIAVTDASILSKVTDGILFVVRAGNTDIRILERSVELLKQVKGNIVGAVLNEVNFSSGYGSYYYYYNYYYYYSDGEKKKKRSRKHKSHVTD